MDVKREQHLSRPERLGTFNSLSGGAVKTYLPLVLVVGGVHLALILVLALSGNLSARNNLPERAINVPAGALQKDCALHRIARVTGGVQVTYGNPAVAREYLEAKASLFPNAWYYIEGGAEAGPDSPKQATVRYCPTCRAAEQRWRSQFSRRQVH
jgi:hypothetical protein